MSKYKTSLDELAGTYRMILHEAVDRFEQEDYDHYASIVDPARAELTSLRAERDTLAAIVERIAVSVRGTNDDNHLTQLETLPDNIDKLLEMWRTAQDGALSEEIRADQLAEANRQLMTSDVVESMPTTLTPRNRQACNRGAEWMRDQAAELIESKRLSQNEIDEGTTWADNCTDKFAEYIRALPLPSFGDEACLAAGCNPLEPQSDDEKAFGVGAWVYCSQHRNPHQTGWCTVSVRDKIGLAVDSAEAALNKCYDFGLKIYNAK